MTFPNILDLNCFIETEGLSTTAVTPDKPSVDKVDDASTTDSGSALDVEDSSVENTSNSLHESDNQVVVKCFILCYNLFIYFFTLSAPLNVNYFG